MPEKKGDHSLAKGVIATILPLPSKIKIEIRLKNHELFKIVLHILVAWARIEETHQKPRVSFTPWAILRNWFWASSFAGISPRYSSSPCKSIPWGIRSFNVHSGSTEVPHPYIIPSMQEANAAVSFSPPSWADMKAVSVSETLLALTNTSLLGRTKTLPTSHFAQRSMEPSCAAALHWLQMWARNGYTLLLDTRK